jgi:NAD(P)-dependent dehydrogenase (short-subunit alcohol dehydrogenase family)
MDRLKDKVALIAGGAEGIGKADAELFAREGARVVIGDIKVGLGEQTAGELRRQGLDVTFVPLNVSLDYSWTSTFDDIKSKYGKVNIVVNNAGISLGKDIEATTLEDWDHIMSVNATGVFLGTKYAIMHMKDNGEDNSIINRSSIDGQVAEAGLFAYCASKGAVTLLTKSAALMCGEKRYRIRVNSVHPGYVQTSLTEKEAADSGMTPDEYFAKVGAQHPIGYIGKPMDIAYADLYLASDESLFVTGSELTIDGGWTAQ